MIETARARGAAAAVGEVAAEEAKTESGEPRIREGIPEISIRRSRFKRR